MVGVALSALGNASGSGTPVDPQIAIKDDVAGLGLAPQVKTAFSRALASEGKISEEALTIRGMSGRKYRRLINNLLETVPNPHYLEVGVLRGSTLCAALFGNDIIATAIDNWSEFGGPYAEFYSNLARFKGRSKVSFLETDFRSVDYCHIGKFNVYLFDGPHRERDQYDGVVRAMPALEDTFVLIVDDWNWDRVRCGTFSAIADQACRIDFLAEIRTSLDGTEPKEIFGQRSDWHNGYMIAALRKPDQQT